MVERAARLLAKLEPGIDPRAPLGTLSPGHRQIVQIASSLDESPGRGAHPARVIVLDEPTSSLSISEVDRLLAIVRRLAAPPHNLTIIYVSHRMGEIFAVCDRVTVLRDGKFVATSVVKDIDEAMLVEQMIGRKVGPTVKRARAADEAVPPLLDVRNLNSPGKLENISLSVRAGEVLGIGGLVGAGRSELLDAVFGLDTEAGGTVIVGGSGGAVELARAGGAHRGPRAAIAAGMGYVPEDRKLQGLFFGLGVGENIVAPFMPWLARPLGIRNLGAEKAHIHTRLREFQVKAAGPGALPGSLSGGNQQKLLIARWMGERTRVLLLDEPTRGIDVGTKAEVYRLVREAADRGLAVLLVSSEMPELLALSDRVVVLCGGRLTGELRGGEMTQDRILRLATMENSPATV
jgi:ABC-type sugar transport system ATPase subunit